MMQRHGCAADFIDEFLTTRLKLFQIRRTKWLIGRSRKNQIRHFEIAYRPVIRSRQRVNLLCDAQRRLTGFVVRPDVAHDCWINRVCENDQGIISYFGSILSARESPRNYDVGISGADQKAKFPERTNFRAELRDSVA